MVWLQKFLGHFTDETEAARVHDRAVLEMKGPEAKTNFPHSEYEVQKQQQQHGSVLPSAAAEAAGGEADENDDAGVAVDVKLGNTHAKLQVGGSPGLLVVSGSTCPWTTL